MSSGELFMDTLVTNEKTTLCVKFTKMTNYDVKDKCDISKGRNC